MSKPADYSETIGDPLIELLAIKLFEHDTVNGEPPTKPNLGWFSLPNADRETFRKIARGIEPLGYAPED